MKITHLNVQNIKAHWLTDNNLTLDVLRADEIHPLLSGNKWFKLKMYLKDALIYKKDAVATFGGAWSNHIVATAFTCHQHQLKCVGIIRGEQPTNLSNSLQLAQRFGMELIFVNRQQYKNKAALRQQFAEKNYYWIDEGGYGQLGALGAAEMLDYVDKKKYTDIVAAVGTGTMLAGLINNSGGAKVTGISSMKGNTGLQEQIKALLTDNETQFELLHNYHFGGYAKYNQQLLDFMNQVYLQHQLPLDVVYTAKTFFAVSDLAVNSYFKNGSKILMIHSGGLQGNRSLPPDVLAF